MQMLPPSKTIILKDSNTQDVYILTVSTFSVRLPLSRGTASPFSVYPLAFRATLPVTQTYDKKTNRNNNKIYATQRIFVDIEFRYVQTFL